MELKLGIQKMVRLLVLEFMPNGKRNGKYYEYYDNGLIKIEAFYENDSLVNEIKYNEKGLKIKN